MLKVLVVLPELSYSGATFISKKICQILKKNGFDVEAWCYQEGEFRKEFDKIGVSIQIIDGNNIYNNKILEEELEKYDLIIVNTILAYAVADVAKNILPTIWYIHEAQNLSEVFWMDIKGYFALKRAEKVYVVSEYAKKYIENRYISDVYILHNSVEDELEKYIYRVSEKNDTVKFLALGALAERKAFDILIYAYMRLSNDEKGKCEIHFAGRIMDSEKCYCSSLLELAEKENAIYHGEIQDRGELLQLMADSDIVVIPSRDESCSLVALEAAMMSKPLIISENVGAKYLVKPDNGWIFRTDDIEALRDVFRKVLTRKDSLKEMGKYSRKMYLQTSTYEIYEKNILNMVCENLGDDKQSYKKRHELVMEKEKQQRIHEKRRKYFFPQIKLLEKKKIVIYAAGEVGEAFYERCMELEYEVIAWVDQNYQKYSENRKNMMEVKGIKEVLKIDYDFICIAVYKKRVMKEIKQKLIEIGVDDEKILWVADFV